MSASLDVDKLRYGYVRCLTRIMDSLLVCFDLD